MNQSVPVVAALLTTEEIKAKLQMEKRAEAAYEQVRLERYGIACDYFLNNLRADLPRAIVRKLATTKYPTYTPGDASQQNPHQKKPQQYLSSLDFTCSTGPREMLPEVFVKGKITEEGMTLEIQTTVDNRWKTTEQMQTMTIGLLPNGRLKLSEASAAIKLIADAAKKKSGIALGHSTGASVPGTYHILAVPAS